MIIFFFFKKKHPSSTRLPAIRLTNEEAEGLEIRRRLLPTGALPVSPPAWGLAERLGNAASSPPPEHLRRVFTIGTAKVGRQRVRASWVWIQHWVPARRAPRERTLDELQQELHRQLRLRKRTPDASQGLEGPGRGLAATSPPILPGVNEPCHHSARCSLGRAALFGSRRQSE